MSSSVYRLLVVAAVIVWWLPIAAWSVEAQEQGNKNADSAKARYHRMKMVRVMDREGWGRPVEAFRLLIPSDWKTEGGVRWVPDLGCPFNIIQLQFRATAPDGVTAIEFFPTYSWVSSDDPMMQQILQQQAQSKMGCMVGPVVGAADFLRQQLAPQWRPDAHVLSSERMPSATKDLLRSFEAINQQFAAAGLQTMRTGEVGRIRLAYKLGPREMEEWITASVVASVSTGMNSAAMLQGDYHAVSRNYQLTGQDILAMRAPKGQVEANGALFSLIFQSVQLHPHYLAAVTQFYANIGRINAQANAERSRIWREAQASIDKTRRETYEYQQKTQDRLNEQFGQMIRGVESYIDPRSNERVELSAGYQNAWSNGTGEYILSETESFDPRVILREDWTLMKKEPGR